MKNSNSSKCNAHSGTNNPIDIYFTETTRYTSENKINQHSNGNEHDGNSGTNIIIGRDFRYLNTNNNLNLNELESYSPESQDSYANKIDFHDFSCVDNGRKVSGGFTNNENSEMNSPHNFNFASYHSHSLEEESHESLRNQVKMNELDEYCDLNVKPIFNRDSNDNELYGNSGTNIIIDRDFLNKLKSYRQESQDNNVNKIDLSNISCVDDGSKVSRGFTNNENGEMNSPQNFNFASYHQRNQVKTKVFFDILNLKKNSAPKAYNGKQTLARKRQDCKSKGTSPKYNLQKTSNVRNDMSSTRPIKKINESHPFRRKNNTFFRKYIYQQINQLLESIDIDPKRFKFNNTTIFKNQVGRAMLKKYRDLPIIHYLLETERDFNNKKKEENDNELSSKSKHSKQKNMKYVAEKNNELLDLIEKSKHPKKDELKHALYEKTLMDYYQEYLGKQFYTDLGKIQEENKTFNRQHYKNEAYYFLEE